MGPFRLCKLRDRKSASAQSGLGGVVEVSSMQLGPMTADGGRIQTGMRSNDIIAAIRSRTSQSL
jgi:hypothetical protein